MVHNEALVDNDAIRDLNRNQDYAQKYQNENIRQGAHQVAPTAVILNPFALHRNVVRLLTMHRHKATVHKFDLNVHGMSATP